MEYFVTFGQKYPREEHPTFPLANKDGYVVVEADSLQHAYELIFEEFGNFWAFVYTKGDWLSSGVMQIAEWYPLGEIGRITEQGLVYKEI